MTSTSSVSQHCFFFFKTGEIHKLKQLHSSPTRALRKRIESKVSKKYTNISIFVAALFTTAKSNLSVHQRMNRQTKCGIWIEWNIVQPFKNNGILTHATPG